MPSTTVFSTPSKDRHRLAFRTPFSALQVTDLNSQKPRQRAARPRQRLARTPTEASGEPEFERSIIDERRREGIAAAKAAGKLTHRPPALTPEQAAEVVARHAQGVPVARIAREAGVSRNTVYKALREANRAVEGTSN